MIKGCNKRVIVMKDTGNEMIEEAFFIIKPEAAKRGFAEGDILRQANKILEKSFYDDKFSHLSMNVSKKTGHKGRLSFWSGAAVGAIVMAAVLLTL